MTTDNTPRRTIANDIFFASVEELLKEGRSVEMLLPGGSYSMRPFLRSGKDEIRLSSAEGVELRKGMVVLFRYGGRHILHRYRGTSPEGRLRMEGDGNYRLTEWVDRGDVVALLTGVRRGRREFSYGSAEWKVRSRWSLLVKRLRTIAIDLKHKFIK